MASPSRVALIVAGSVLALLTLCAGGLFAVNHIILASYGPLRAPVKTARTSAMELRRAAEVWRGAHASDQCPTPEMLRADRAIDPASRLTDSWGAPFQIICDPDETTVVSFGPDGKAGTADDIRVPERSTPSR